MVVKRIYELTAWAVIVGAGVAGCSTNLVPAPVVEKSVDASGSAATPTNPGDSVVAAPVPGLAPAPSAGVTPVGPGFYRVMPGDTLYGIARMQKQKPDDLIKWNSLPASKQVNIGQVLRVAPPGAVVAAPVVSEAGKPKAAQPPLLNSPAPAAPAVSSAESEPSAGKGLSLIWPAQGNVVTQFGAGGSKGVDISGKVGSPVRAAAAGKVVYAGSGLRAYGQMIIVKHGGDFLTAYAHNDKLLVHEGENVKQGETIAQMGTGPSGKPTLHFELRKSGKAVDPMPWLTRQGG
jgi:lipoprotein NlpD